MSVDFRIVIAVVALLSTAPLSGGYHHFSVTPRMQELAVTQLVNGVTMIVGLEMASGTNGELSFRLGPFLPGNPLMLGHVDPKLSTSFLRASAQHAP